MATLVCLLAGWNLTRVPTKETLTIAEVPTPIERYERRRGDGVEFYLSGEWPSCTECGASQSFGKLPGLVGWFTMQASTAHRSAWRYLVASGSMAFHGTLPCVAGLACGLQVLITVVAALAHWNDVVTVLSDTDAPIRALNPAHPPVAAQYSQGRITS
jgi:hypothetical protein